MANKIHLPAVYGLMALLLSCCDILAASPKAAFSATPVSGCSPLKVDFINSSSNAVAYQWLFGNGNHSILAVPSAVYITAGKYTVTLIAKDAKGVSDTLVLKDFITVFQSPTADFISDKKVVCAKDSVRFLDASKQGNGAIVSYKWDLGNGQIARSNVFTCGYPLPGVYDVALAITDVNGCTSIKKTKDFILANNLPVIKVQSDNRFQCSAPAMVNLYADITGKAPYTYAWKFSDGGTSNQAKPNHSFASAGKYDVSVMVKDANGCSNAVTENAFVVIHLPVAAFKANKTGLCEDGTVSFSNVCSPLNGKGRFHWNFGNGDTTNIENPHVKFPKAGKYDITLTYYWDNCVVTHTEKAMIDVKPAPTGRISPGDTSLCRADRGDLMLRAVGKDFNKIEWTAGSDYSKMRVTTDSGNYAFPADTGNGVYYMKAKMYSPFGCGTVEDSIKIVVRGPYADMCLTNKAGCIPYNGSASFCGSSVDPVATYKWIGFGQTYPVNLKSINFTNKKFGVSVLRMVVTDINGCSDEDIDFMAAGIPVDAKLDTDKKVICNSEVLTIYNYAKQKNRDTVAFFWSWFGKDTLPLGYGDSVKVRFRTNPSKNVKITVTSSSYGCAAQAGVTIEVLGPLVEGMVKAYCEQDSFKGWNFSSDYTNTYWKYTNAQGKKMVEPNLFLGHQLRYVKSPWIFAENNKNNCKDSIQLDVAVDPQDAAFTYDLKCGSSILKAKNLYQGLHDTMFTWTLTHKASGEVTKLRNRDLYINLQKSGDYSLKLEAVNKNYMCTRSTTVDFYISPAVDHKPLATIDRNSCYPVKLELKDAYYKEWTQATWKVGSTMQVSDSAENIYIEYISNESVLPVYLVKTDRQGCKHIDTFGFQIGGARATISMMQDNKNCLAPVCHFSAQNNNTTSGVKCTYEWNFGHRISKLQNDTVQLCGSAKVTAMLTMSDEKGCKSRDNKEFDIKIGKPHAKFVVLSDTLEACPPLQVMFADSSTSEYGPITYRSWNFGDGSSSEKLLPGKLYVVPGKYPVSVEVANGSGCRDTFEIPDLVVVKGPVGTYALDKLSGCLPLVVNLNSKVSNNVAKYDFDMGDGVVLDLGAKAHTYNRPGQYIPRLILVDSNGCKYSPDPKDTIVVYASPVAQLSGGEVCKNAKMELKHQSVSLDPIVAAEWFEDGKLIGQNTTQAVRFGTEEMYAIGLRVTTSHKCKDSTGADFRTYGVKAGISVQKEEVCLGDKIQFNEDVKSDTTLAFRRLVLGDEVLLLSDAMRYVATKRGVLPLQYVATDVLGCSDTVISTDFLKIGDTLAPPALTIYRTTVQDNSTQTLFAPSKEVDYKGHSLYVFKNGYWQEAAKAENVYDTNLVATGLNTLKNSYCHIIRQQNFCGMVSDTVKVVPHCTIEVTAMGDTNAALVNWTPYTGWKSLAAYKVWRKKATDIHYTYLATVAPDKLNYIDSAVYCNAEYDYTIEGVEDGGFLMNSFSDTSRAKPVHIISVPAPEVWRTTVNDNAYTHTEWIMPAHKYPVKYYTLYRQDAALGLEFTETIYAPNLNFDDYKTDVQSRNYTYTVTATDICDITSIQSNVGRSILLDVKKADEDQNAALNWTPYVVWNEGVESYKVERSISGGDFVSIGSVDGLTTQFTDKYLPKTCEKDIKYRITAVRAQPAALDSTHYAVSVSNEVDYTPEIRFYIPSAFTPDQNNLNEGFRPDGVFFYKYDMKIYNRYGQKVYDNDVCLNAWDGRYMDEIAQEGTYVYLITAWDMAGKSYQFRGSVTLLR